MIQLSQLAFLYNRIKGQYFLAVNPSLIIIKKNLWSFPGFGSTSQLMHPFLTSRAMKLLKIWYLRWDIRHFDCHISLSISQSSEGAQNKNYSISDGL